MASIQRTPTTFYAQGPKATVDFDSTALKDMGKWTAVEAKLKKAGVSADGIDTLFGKAQSLNDGAAHTFTFDAKGGKPVYSAGLPKAVANPQYGQLKGTSDPKQVGNANSSDLSSAAAFKPEKKGVDSGLERDTDFKDTGALIKLRAELGLADVKSSVFVADLKDGAHLHDLIAPHTKELNKQLDAVLTSLERGDCGIRWLGLDDANKLVVAGRIANAMRAAAAYALDGEEHGSVAEAFADDKVYVQGSYIWGCGSDQPHDLDVVIVGAEKLEVDASLYFGGDARAPESIAIGGSDVSHLPYSAIALWGGDSIPELSVPDQWAILKPELAKFLSGYAARDDDGKAMRIGVSCFAIYQRFLGALSEAQLDKVPAAAYTQEKYPNAKAARDAYAGICADIIKQANGLLARGSIVRMKRLFTEHEKAWPNLMSFLNYAYTGKGA